MNLNRFLSRKTFNALSRLHGRILPLSLFVYEGTVASFATVISPLLELTPDQHSRYSPNLKYGIPFSSFNRHIHSNLKSELIGSAVGPEREFGESEDGAMNEFLSRFVWIMRGKLSEAYPDIDKQTMDGMLLIIVGNVVSEMEKGASERNLGEAGPIPSHDFSEDLWKTVWEVSNKVLDDMHKARKKEKMKEFLQSEEVKEMYRFAGEVGIRGEMLRELRFKWACEKMEESEFYQSLERLREEEVQLDKQEGETAHTVEGAVESNFIVGEEKPNVVSIPKRHGKIKYKIYGLDLSDPRWAEVADKIHDRGEIIWPQEPKPITGKCKLVTERILTLKLGENPVPLLAEWKELLQPSRIDWITLLNRLKESNGPLYFEIAELVLEEESFKTSIRDYSMLIEAHAEENRLEDAEKILKKMNEKGIVPDILTLNVLVHMYSKAGNLERAKEAFENLRSHNVQFDTKIYNSMIMVCVNAGQPKLADSLVKEMEARNMKATEEIYMAVLRAFSKCGDVTGAQRIATTMQFAGFQPTLESCTLLVMAFAEAGEPNQAKSNFDYMIKIGIKPDDRCIASMIAAYAKKNLLDKALNFILELEKDGYDLGAAGYSVLVDWLGKMQLIDEAEIMLGKIAEMGESPPLKVHVSLCDMYGRAGLEKKALQALEVVEAKKEQLGKEDFERIIDGLLKGGFAKDARRLHGLMEAQGFAASESIKVNLMASQALRSGKRTLRPR